MTSVRAPKAPKHWDQRFLHAARMFAGWSKDPSTKVGAVAVRDRRILVQGYNGLPSGLTDSDTRLKNRDTRLSMTVHAEMNCIAFAARIGVCLAGATMYIWPFMACSQCAASLIQADIAQIIIPDFVEPYRWQESFDHAREMCVEAGIAVHRIPMDGALDGSEVEEEPLESIKG